MPAQWEYKLEKLGVESAAVTQRLTRRQARRACIVTALPASLDDLTFQRLVFRREVTNLMWDH